ncbi:MAG: asparagine synthetase B [Pseudomonadota bacterium]
MGGLAGFVDFEGPGVGPGLGRAMAARISGRGRGRAVGGPFAGRSELWRIGPGKPVFRGPLGLVLDGAVYNRRELAGELGLTVESDAELVLALLEARGYDSLALVNGDFAGALFDSGRNELILFRDRFGVRPLVWTRAGSSVFFASEPRALAARPGFRPQPNEAMLFDYLATHYRYLFRDPARTFFHNVFQVPPAGFVRFTRESESTHAYWRLEQNPKTKNRTPEEAAEKLKFLVRDAAARRLDENKKMGFSLSSGMDSSSVTGLAAEVLGRKVDIYSVGYGYGEYDESAGAAPAAQKFGSSWKNIPLSDPELFFEIATLIRRTGEPACTVTWLSHFHLARNAAADGQEILFSGLGGDECLAGEYEHFLYFFADLKRKGLERRLESEVACWIRLHDHPVFKKSWNVVEDVFRRLVDLDAPGLIHYDRDRYQKYLPWFEPDFVGAWDREPSMPHPFDSYLANRCFQDLTLETTPPSLAEDEKNTAAFGLETRFPFLDHRVVEFCFSLPEEWKYDRGVTKAPLRRAMHGVLPRANLTNTVKTGFNAPAHVWLAGRDRENVLDLIHSRSFISRGRLKPGAAEALFREHLSGRANHMMFFWQLINAELWERSLSETNKKADP